jgi:GNAT superfamily N-acetyltransferase
MRSSGAVVCDRAMALVMRTPDVDELSEVVDVLAQWQHDGAAMQLHPGDLGWFWRFGAEATAAAVRTWSIDHDLVAIGLLDSQDVLRLTIAPDARRDRQLARRLVDDVSDPAKGVLPAGRVCLDAPTDAVVHGVLSRDGWGTGEQWTPLRRDLTSDVPDPGVRIEVTGPDQAAARVSVQRAAFDKSTFSVDRWNTMAAGVAYAGARCLVAYDDTGTAVAAVTVWSAGAGRTGLLEPMGVHRDHRGRGYGTAITLAAADALRLLGSSSALVCTPSALSGAVATYVSAGFQRLPAIADRCRD